MYTTCRVGVLSSEISKHSKISPPPSLRSHLTSSPMGVLSGDYGNIAAAVDLVPTGSEATLFCTVEVCTELLILPMQAYRNLPKIRPWAMNFNGSSNRGVGFFRVF